MEIKFVNNKPRLLTWLRWLPLVLVLAITATTVTADTSSYVLDSFWMADPLFTGTPGDPTGAQPGDTVPGYWYRDTTNQNALAQYTHDQFTDSVITLYDTTNLKINMYNSAVGTNVTLISTPNSYMIVGCGGGTNEATSARNSLYGLITGKTLAGVIMTDTDDEDLWGCNVWTKISTSAAVYGNSSFDDAYGFNLFIKTEQLSRNQMFHGTSLPWGTDSFLGAGTMGEYRAVPPQFIRDPFVRISTKTDITLEGNTITLTPTFDSDAGLMVYIPEPKIIILGEFFGHFLPDGLENMNNSRISPTDVCAFLDDMRRLTQDNEAGILVYKSGTPVIGYTEVLNAFLAQRDGVQYLRNQTIEKINLGYSLDDIVATTHLPDALSSSPYNQEFASDQASIIRWVYTYFMGWFSGEPVELANTLTATTQAQILADAYGGIDPLTEAARQAELAASDQAGAEKALYLAYSVYKLSPDNLTVKQIYAQTLRKIAFMQKSAYKRNYYLSTVQKITDVNTAPVVYTAIADVTVDEDAADVTVDLTGVFTDADGDTLNITAVSSNSALVSTEVSGMSLTLDILDNQNGAATVTVTAIDTFGAWVADEITVTVNPMNDTPVVAAPIADITVDEDAADTTIDLTTVFSDVDTVTNAETLTYTVENSNPGLVSAVISGSTLTLDYLENQKGAATIKVTATETAGTAITDEFTITVNPVNDPPVVSTPIADVTVEEDANNSTVDLTSVFSDIDADALTLTAVSGSSDLVSVTVDSTTLTLDYQENQYGTAVITVTAADPGGAAVTDEFTVTVNPVDDAPWANGQAILVTVGIPRSITLEYGDAETAQADMTFQITTAPVHGALSGTAPDLIYTAESGYIGEDSFTYLVSDGGMTAEATLSIQVAQTGISGRVFNDANANGTLDEGETGMAGVTIQLIKGSSTIEGATAEDGSYAFGSLLPGIYQVRQVLLQGTVQTTPNPADINLAEGQTVPDINFGMVISADLKVNLTANLNYFTIVYTFTVTNEGPAAAKNIILADTLPSGVSYLSVITTQGYCTGLKKINCKLGSLASGNSATVTIKVLRISKNAIVNSATLSSDIFDIDMADNTATATIQ